jgi:hypothetical protein
MVLSEICSSSFLFSVAIIIILVGGLFAYFNHRFSVQNHKISSMMGLVTTMAEEMQYFRSRISGKSTQDVQSDSNVDQIHIIPQFLGGQSELNNLIEVSDDEDDDDSDEESDDDNDSEEESDEESESEDESDNESESEDESDNESESGNQVKNISIDLGNEIDLNLDNEFINVHETTSGESSSENAISEGVSNGDTKTINLSEDISSFEISSKTLENIHDIDISIKLTDDYIDLSSSAVDKDKIDYKKMSINKLREVAVEKGLVVDASKLKKNDILKLLGAEQ